MIDHLAVIIPAHNEEDEIVDCLTSVVCSAVLAQRKDPELRVQVIVVADACTDGTHDVVAGFAQQNPLVEILSTSYSNVGRARDAAGRLLLRSLRDAHPQALETAWMAFTDADSRVPEQWVATHLHEALLGADCLVGTVAPRPETGSADLIARWHETHHLVEGHPYVFGANLGLRAAYFERVEGIPALSCGEDAAVVAEILKAGGKVRRTDSCRVLTSARLDGRVQGGFSTYLQSLI